jgi:C4-dicarboxylate-specific signal transduction histidine kinase
MPSTSDVPTLLPTRPPSALTPGEYVTGHVPLSPALRYAHRMETIGRLAAGIAHEINTPVQFTGDSIAFLADSFASLAPVLSASARLRDGVPAGAAGEMLAQEVGRAAAAVELDYLRDEIPTACDSAAAGIGRVAELARAIALLSGRAAAGRAVADLNRIVETVLVVSRNEYKYFADVTLDLAPLPAVPCVATDVTHALLVVVLNAAQAIAARRETSPGQGRIAVRSWCGDGCVGVAVSDDGGGIPDEIQGTVFHPFVTTKQADEHLGYGLAVARAIVVEDHAGTLTFETAVGAGTTFEMTLPVGTDERHEER